MILKTIFKIAGISISKIYTKIRKREIYILRQFVTSLKRNVMLFLTLLLYLIIFTLYLHSKTFFYDILISFLRRKNILSQIETVFLFNLNVEKKNLLMINIWIFLKRKQGEIILQKFCILRKNSPECNRFMF